MGVGEGVGFAVVGIVAGALVGAALPGRTIGGTVAGILAGMVGAVVGSAFGERLVPALTRIGGVIVQLVDIPGLIRVNLRHDRVTDAEPLALHPGATVASAAAELHNEIGTVCHGARLRGPSTRFDGQLVGREHRLQDGDTVEIVT